jgi:hypothetical protein
MPRGVEMEFRTGVSRQPIGPIFKGQEVREEFIGLLEEHKCHLYSSKSLKKRVVNK